MAGPVIIVIGAPGAGKGTQSELLAKRLGGVHLSSGELLRQSHDEIAKNEMASGELVDLETFTRVVGSALSSVPSDKPLILDGFIRLNEDVAWLEVELAKIGRQIDQVLFINVDEGVGTERNLERKRKDDTVSVLARRWADYHSETEPVIEALRLQFHLVEVDGHGTVDEVAARIADKVKL